MKTKKLNVRTKQSGVTLIELMVAMAVSSVIMLGVSNIYFSTKKSYVIHDEFARLQENVRYAIETLSVNIRNAGFFGCSSGQGLGNFVNGLNSSNESEWNFETGLMGYEAIGTDIGDTKVLTPSTPSADVNDWVTAAGLTSDGVAISTTPNAAIANIAIEGSDILVIRTTDGAGIRLLKNNGSNIIRVENDGNTGTCPDSSTKYNGLCQNDILLVSDCSNSRIFQISGMNTVASAACDGQSNCLQINHAASSTPGNKPSDGVTWNPPGNIFTEDAEIMRVVTKAYFVGVSNGQPTLFVRENADAPVPLVQGIENMQILYGIDTDEDGVANQYVSADNVTDVDGDSDTVFESVVSIKLSLLVRTPNDLPGINRTTADYANLTYDMVSPASPITIDPIETDSTSTDRRLRKVYNLTIKIRNKSFNTAVPVT